MFGRLLHQRPLWGGLVGSGFISLLTGVGILATDEKQANHNYGWALLAIGLAAMLVGGLMYLLLTRGDGNGRARVKSRADDNSTALAAGRDIKMRDFYAAPSPVSRSGVVANVVFDGFDPVLAQPIAMKPQRIDQPTLAQFARLRFVNEVDEPSEEADVPNLHAVIHVGDSLVVPDGRWADNPDRGSAPSRETKSVDLPSTGETRILDVVMRPYGYNECFGWDHNGHRIPAPSIPTGAHHVMIQLTGARMKRRTFEFILDNPLERDSSGVIEHSYIELIEPWGSVNPCSGRRARERRTELISKLQSFIPAGNRLLEIHGRPELGMRADGLKAIGEWLQQADHAIALRCSDYLADFRNDGVDIFKGSVVSVDLLHGRLGRLVEIIKEIRQK